MPSPIAAFAPPFRADESDFATFTDPAASPGDAEYLSEFAEETLTERQMLVSGLAHFFAGFSSKPE